MTLDNSKGQVFFGMHFYPGLAEYREPGQKPERVYLNEDTIREMGPSFEGRPVFVFHKDEVDTKLDKLKLTADGWVIKSFYNESDGKHWVQFIVCSEKGLHAIQNGYKLSNCYTPKMSAHGGQWNGVDYDREITAGEYEHLALVPNPRYAESIVMTPEDFKKYNHEKSEYLKKVTNSIHTEELPMKFFKRQKIENAKELDLENVLVELPKSKKEMSIAHVINAADEAEVARVASNEPRLCNDSDFVEIEGEIVLVSELVKIHNAAKCAADEMKNDEDDMDDDSVENEEDPDDDDAPGADEEKKGAEKQNKKNKKKNDDDGLKRASELRDLKPTRRLANAGVEDFSVGGGVARGKDLFGSGR